MEFPPLQGWYQYLSILNDRHVITVTIGLTSQLHAHNLKLIYKSMECLHSSFHWYKLSPEDGSLDSWLLLRQPSKEFRIYEDKKISAWTWICLVTRMVTINHHYNINFFLPCLKRIWRNCFGGTTIELLQFSAIIKGGLLNYRISWVNEQKGLCLCFRYAIICKTAMSCPSWGSSRNNDKIETSVAILMQPISNIHLITSIKDLQ